MEFLTIAKLALKAYVTIQTRSFLDEDEKLTAEITSLSVGAGESELLKIERLKRKRRLYREYLSSPRSNVSDDDQG